MASWKDVDEVALSFPTTVRATAYGSRAWRVKKRMLVWERPLRGSDREALGESAPEGDILGLRTADVAERDALIAANPEVFFTTPHFDGSPAVLARLERLDVEVLRRLVEAEWLRSAPRGAVRAYRS